MSTAVVLCLMGAVAGSCLGLAALARSQRTLVHWSFLAGMVALAAESGFGALVLQQPGEDAAFWQRLRMGAASCLPVCWLLFSVLYSRGDSDRRLRRAWPLLAVASLTPLLGIQSLRVDTVPGRPGGATGLVFPLDASDYAIELLLLLSSVLILMNLERTFRGSIGTMRWRIKYVVVGLAVVFAVRIYASSQNLLYRSVDASVEAPLLAIALVVGSVLVGWSLVRSALGEVLVYPSDQLLQGSIALSLSAVYLLLTGLLAHVLAPLGEEASLLLKAALILLSVVVLCILLLSERMRQWSRRIVSRHLKRPFYNYQRIWMAYADQTSSLLNEADFCRAVAKLSAKTFQALSLTIWLVDDEGKLAFGASTSLRGTEPQTGLDDPKVRTGLIEGMRSHPFPVNVDESEEKWVETLKAFNPDFFRKGGNRICMPLVARNEVLGLIILGDRVNGLPFSLEDVDLLKCIGEQIAASLLNQRLSQKLLRARELEAFQSMSAFFVHDLKNTAHSLSLLLQNLRAHFHDPAFRKDAERAVFNSVEHLNTLISRLGLLRQKIEIAPRAVELKAVIESALEALPWSRSEIKVHEDAVGEVMVDPELMEKVVVNLALNAKEASVPGAPIEIRTEQRPGWAVLSVQDRGCGMSPEFLAKSLFRPFQTTKKAGLGIGMFHSKTIVEAHHGRIEVESQAGQGTTVRVLLPWRGQPA